MEQPQHHLPPRHIHQSPHPPSLPLLRHLRHTPSPHLLLSTLFLIISTLTLLTHLHILLPVHAATCLASNCLVLSPTFYDVFSTYTESEIGYYYPPALFHFFIALIVIILAVWLAFYLISLRTAMNLASALSARRVLHVPGIWASARHSITPDVIQAWLTPAEPPIRPKEVVRMEVNAHVVMNAAKVHVNPASTLSTSSVPPEYTLKLPVTISPSHECLIEVLLGVPMKTVALFLSDYTKFKARAAAGGMNGTGGKRKHGSEKKSTGKMKSTSQPAIQTLDPTPLPPQPAGSDIEMQPTSRITYVAPEGSNNIIRSPSTPQPNNDARPDRVVPSPRNGVRSTTPQPPLSIDPHTAPSPLPGAASSQHTSPSHVTAESESKHVSRISMRERRSISSKRGGGGGGRTPMGAGKLEIQIPSAQQQQQQQSHETTSILGLLPPASPFSPISPSGGGGTSSSSSSLILTPSRPLSATMHLTSGIFAREECLFQILPQVYAGKDAVTTATASTTGDPSSSSSSSSSSTRSQIHITFPQAWLRDTIADGSRCCMVIVVTPLLPNTNNTTNGNGHEGRMMLPDVSERSSEVTIVTVGPEKKVPVPVAAAATTSSDSSHAPPTSTSVPSSSSSSAPAPPLSLPAPAIDSHQQDAVADEEEKRAAGEDGLLPRGGAAGVGGAARNIQQQQQEGKEGEVATSSLPAEEEGKTTATLPPDSPPLSPRSPLSPHTTANLRDSITQRIKFDRQLIVTGTQAFEMEELYGLEEIDSECIICLTELRDIILLPCKHVCICSSCLKSITKCPICRSRLYSHMKFEKQEVVLGKEGVVKDAAAVEAGAEQPEEQPLLLDDV